MKQIYKALFEFLSDRFNLDDDKQDEPEIINSIRKNVDFKGANLWTLIFAILIASIGLNVNSTAVIIGAMLISPLMGPIMGVGLGIGINDLALVKKGMRNLLIATIISIVTSTIYFTISPLQSVQSELLARTSPSLWDVFIAFFGGLAGIVAGTRKEKTNVIPGVAIATALMPPLCTAGFGLATGNWYFFIGAIYLYFINSVFICIATYLIVRYLKFHKKEFEDKAVEKRVNRYIIAVVLITVTPSIYLAYRIVDKSIFENSARKFVDDQFTDSRIQVISRTFKYDNQKKEIDLVLIGDELPASTIDTLKSTLASYNLSNTDLTIRQGLNAKQEIDFSQIKASILEDVFKRDSVTHTTTNTADQEVIIPDLKDELTALYPNLQTYIISKVKANNIPEARTDTLILVVARFDKPFPSDAQAILRNWFTSRLKADSVRLIIEQ